MDIWHDLYRKHNIWTLPRSPFSTWVQHANLKPCTNICCDVLDAHYLPFTGLVHIKCITLSLTHTHILNLIMNTFIANLHSSLGLLGRPLIHFTCQTGSESTQRYFKKGGSLDCTMLAGERGRPAPTSWFAKRQHTTEELETASMFEEIASS